MPSFCNIRLMAGDQFQLAAPPPKPGVPAGPASKLARPLPASRASSPSAPTSLAPSPPSSPHVPMVPESDLQALQVLFDEEKKSNLDLLNQKNRLETEILALTEKIDSLEMDKESADLDNESLALERDQLAAEKEIAELDCLEARHSLESTHAELMTVREELASLKRTAALAAESNGDNTGEGGDSSSLVEILQAQVKKYQDALRIAYADLQREKAKTSRLDSALKAEERNVESANQRVGQLQEMLPQLDKARADINDLKEQLDQARTHESMLERLTAKNLEKDEKIRELTDSVAELEELYDTSNALAEELDELQRSLREEILAKDTDLLNLHQDVKRQEAEIRELEHQNSRFRNALQVAQSELKMHRQTLAELERSGVGASNEAMKGIVSRALDLDPEVFRIKALQSQLKLEQFTCAQWKQQVEVLEALLPDTDFFADKEVLKSVLACSRALYKAQFVADHLENLYLDAKASKALAKDLPKISNVALDTRNLTHVLQELKQYLITSDYPKFVKFGRFYRSFAAVDITMTLVVERVVEDVLVVDQKVLKDVEDALQTVTAILTSEGGEISKIVPPGAATFLDPLHGRAPHMPLRWALQVSSERSHTYMGAVFAEIRRIASHLETLFDNDMEGFRLRLSPALCDQAKLLVDNVETVKLAANKVVEASRVLALRSRASKVTPTQNLLNTLDGVATLLLSLRAELGEGCDDLEALASEDVSRVTQGLTHLTNMFVSRRQVADAIMNSETTIQNVSSAMVNGELREEPDVNDIRIDSSKGELWQINAIHDRVGTVKALLGNTAKLEEQLEKTKAQFKQADMASKTAQVNVRDAEHRAIVAEEKLQALRARVESVEQDATRLNEAIEKAKKLEAAAQAQLQEITDLQTENSNLKKKVKQGGSLRTTFSADGEDGVAGGEGGVVNAAVLQPMQDEIDNLRLALLQLQKTKNLAASAAMLKSLGGPSLVDSFSVNVPVFFKLRSLPASQNLKNLTNDALPLTISQPEPFGKKPADPSQVDVKQQVSNALKDLQTLVSEIEQERCRSFVYKMGENASPQLNHQKEMEAKALILRSRVNNLLSQISPSPATLRSLTSVAMLPQLPAPVNSQPVSRLRLPSSSPSRIVPLKVASLSLLA
eukprot:c12475_g1_i1.p1 GENE.c12475_g1_i1~~c12475_g1_i1.p1  ORF type:complete len:1129 (+),score=338.80 c12475_g1_i1:587-3973(+)